MKKAKFVIMILFTSILLLVVSNVSRAETEYTYKDEAQGIEWAYQLDDSDNVINLRCKTTTKTGKVEIPSTIDGKTVISLNGISNNEYIYPNQQIIVQRLCWNNRGSNS